jgi:hypothetical protein
MRRVALLPHVFVAGHRQAPPPTAYVTGRALRAAIAANAALMTFAGDDDATRALGGHDPFAAPAHAPDAAAAAAPPDAAPAHAAPAHAAPAHAADAAPADAAPAQPPNSAPDRAGRDRAA